MAHAYNCSAGGQRQADPRGLLKHEHQVLSETSSLHLKYQGREVAVDHDLVSHSMGECTLPNLLIKVFSKPLTFPFFCFWIFLTHLRFSYNHSHSCVAKVKCKLIYTKNKNKLTSKPNKCHGGFYPQIAVHPLSVSLVCCCIQFFFRRDVIYKGRASWSPARNGQAH